MAHQVFISIFSHSVINVEQHIYYMISAIHLMFQHDLHSPKHQTLPVIAVWQTWTGFFVLFSLSLAADTGPIVPCFHISVVKQSFKTGKTSQRHFGFAKINVFGFGLIFLKLLTNTSAGPPPIKTYNFSPIRARRFHLCGIKLVWKHTDDIKLHKNASLPSHDLWHLLLAGTITPLSIPWEHSGGKAFHLLTKYKVATIEGCNREWWLTPQSTQDTGTPTLGTVG